LVEGVGSMHLALSAGTRSIAVDRRSPHFETVVRAAIEWADAVIVGARPKTPSAWASTSTASPR